jgi:hypothetical protein
MRLTANHQGPESFCLMFQLYHVALTGKRNTFPHISSAFEAEEDTSWNLVA